MREVVVTYSSAASPDVVWAVMTDVDHWAEIHSGIVAVERLDAGTGFGPGLRWRETRLLAGKTHSEELSITELDVAAHRYVVEASSHGMDYRSEVSVTPAGTGSQLRMTFHGVPRTTAARLMARTMAKLFESSSRSALLQDLTDIASAAEAAAA